MLDQTSIEPEEKITRFQLMALSLCLLLNMQDGFDILSIAYTANSIAMDWNLSPAKLGAILSASLFGMMLGAMLLGPFADKYGRKTLTVLGLIVCGVGMTGAALSINADMLLVCRVLTGFGIGGILASLNTLVAEYSGRRYRSMAVAIFQMGYPLGAVLGGFIAAWLLDIGSWRHVFGFGAIMSFAFVPVMMLLPESKEYLAKSGNPDALVRINAINRSMGKDPIAELPPSSNEPKPSLLESVLLLLGPVYWKRTILIWLSFFFLLMSLYFVLSWVPKLLIEQGLSQEQSIKGGIALNLMGVVGVITFAVISIRYSAMRLAMIYLVGGSGILLLLGSMDASNSALLVVVAFAGFFMHTSMIALYAVTAGLYPPEIRATGTGWAIGLSRFGAMFGPWATGMLLASGWSPNSIYPLFALPTLVAACFVALLIVVKKQQEF